MTSGQLWGGNISGPIVKVPEEAKMSARGLLRVTLFSFLVWVVAASLAWAQLPTSTLNGIVTDPHGAAVARAKVTLASQATRLARDTVYRCERHDGLAELAA